jgi:spore photoproduct lyase
MKLPRAVGRIFLEEAAQHYQTTRRVLARLPGVPVTVIPDRSVIKPPHRDPADWLGEAKRTLLLAVQKGPFLRPCPGTPDYICCGYQVLQVALGCPLDCTYCILQGYVNVPAITVFVNVEDLLEELEARWAESPARVWRLGTGEFGDSLALDALMGLNERLIPLFTGRRRAVLEIKSKWAGEAELAPLLALGPNPRIVFAWSMNPPAVIRGEERFTAALDARLKAASRAAAAGFRVAFHFDPIIYFPGWEEAYRSTVERLGEALPGVSVAWVSLGTLRFPTAMRSLIFRRFPHSRAAAQEMVRAPDGKLRYFKDLRVEMYGRLKEWLGPAAPGALVYLCMESPRVWRQVFGFAPEGDALARLLDRKVPEPD